MHNILIDLLRMLEYRRPAGTLTERHFVDQWIMSLPGHPYRDPHGNVHVEIGTGSSVLWSAHTDTVHTTGGMQTLNYNRESGIVGLSKRARNRGSNCLGADCTVGVWILRNMILRGIPGRYIFHYGEERGGIGSSALAKQSADWLKRFQFAIAFDRRSTGSIITHQHGWRTASDVFALSLEEELAKHGLHYAADDSGVYTDTYEYAEIIPECTNLSVGNSHEHRQTETANTLHATKLLDAMCALNVGQLLVDRDPASAQNDERTGTIGGNRSQVYSFDSWKRLYGSDRDVMAGNPAYAQEEDSIFGTCLVCGDTLWIDSHTFT